MGVGTTSIARIAPDCPNKSTHCGDEGCKPAADFGEVGRVNSQLDHRPPPVAPIRKGRSKAPVATSAISCW